MWILLHTAKYCLTSKHAFSVNENVLRSGHKLQSESASEIEFVVEVFVVALVNLVNYSLSCLFLRGSLLFCRSLLLSSSSAAFSSFFQHVHGVGFIRNALVPDF